MDGMPIVVEYPSAVAAATFQHPSGFDVAGKAIPTLAEQLSSAFYVAREITHLGTHAGRFYIDRTAIIIEPFTVAAPAFDRPEAADLAEEFLEESGSHAGVTCGDGLRVVPCPPRVR